MKLKKIMSTILTLTLAISLMTTLTTFSQETDETDTIIETAITTETSDDGTVTDVTETTEPDDVTPETTLPNFEDFDCYYLIYDTLGYEASDILEPILIVKDTELIISRAAIYRDGYANYAWTDGENIYLNGGDFVMPEHNVTLTPLFHKFYTVTYSAGDYEGISGHTKVAFDRYETFTFDLANSSRFSRAGYNLTHWIDVDTNEKYSPISQYKMPSRDVTLEAVWAPITYNILFSSNTPIKASFTFAGTCGTEITLPRNRFKYEGYKFVGWSYGSEVYKAGDKFTVPAAKPGLSLSLKAIWEPTNGVEEPIITVFNYVALKQQIGKGEVTSESIRQSKTFLLNCKD